jgi:Tfp pilus assembly protein PilX
MRYRPPDLRTRIVHGEEGAALAIVLMAMALLMVLGGAILTVAITEARIAAHHRDGLEALHAADALVERLRSELRQAPDAQAVLTGDFRSSLRDGPPSGNRRIGGVVIDLSGLTNLEQCGSAAPCSRKALTQVNAERPWGADNPVWRLYSHGWMTASIGGGERAVYLVAWVGDDPYENDGDPLRDGAGAGRGRLALRVRAYGGHGARRDIDAVVTDIPRNPRLIRWMER